MPLGYENNKKALLSMIEAPSFTELGPLYKLLREYDQLRRHHYRQDEIDSLYSKILQHFYAVKSQYEELNCAVGYLVLTQENKLLIVILRNIEETYYPSLDQSLRLYNALSCLLQNAARYNSLPAFNLALSTATKNHLDIQALFNCQYSESLEPIIVTAAANDSIDVLKALLDAGADIEVRDRVYQGSALHMACDNEGDLACISELIKRGADITSQDSLGDTPATIAAKANNVEALKLLFPDVREPSSLNLPNKNGYTPIAAAADLKKWDAVRFLLHIGADLKLNIMQSTGNIMHSVLNVMYDKKPPKDIAQSVFDQVKETLSTQEREYYVSRFVFEDKQVQGLQ